MTAPRTGPDHAAELAADFAAIGPFGTCDRLGLKHRREGRTAWICCPWHSEQTPSCTVAIGPCGTIRVHCFACARTWDVHALVAQLRGLDCAGDFRSVLLEEAELLGRSDIAAALEGRAAERGARGAACSSGHFLFLDHVSAGHELSRTAPPRPAPQPEPERTYPPRDEVLDLIAGCSMTAGDPDVSRAVEERGLVPSDLDCRGLAYALPASASLPAWARYRGRSWLDTGHRIIVPVVDASGVVRSVRASRVGPGDTPKRLPPAGHKASGLVMADAMAVEVLRAGAWPSWDPGPAQVVIAEGEPDFWTWAVRTPLHRPATRATIGIWSGAWTAELAARIPDGATVAVWTDQDPAGNRYAQTIADSLAGRCSVIRGEP